VGRLIGAFYFDSRPIEIGAQVWNRALADSIRSRASGESTPGLSIECTAAPGERPRENGRMASPSGDICTWDGRLDNREDLLLQLGRNLPEDPCDCALALELFRARGIQGLRDLIGDWSLAIWDSKSRTLVLASDYAGVRPLYYHAAPHGVLWSSSLSDLVEGMGASLLDVEYVARFLTRGQVAFRTPYRDVLPVPPGHAVSVREQGVSVEAFWRPAVGQSIGLRDERDYEEQLRCLFGEAVRVRLRTDSPVCAELSGGLDSSSVVAMADGILGGGRTPRLVTFSYTHKNCRDQRYFEALERERNLNGIHFDLEKVPFVAADQAGKAAPGWWEPRFVELAREMNRLGSRVLLTGQFGDFIMGNTPDDSDQVVDYLDRGRRLRAWREACAWGQSQQVPVYPIFWRALKTKYLGWNGSLAPAGASGGGPYAGVDSLAKALAGKLEWEERRVPGALAWKEAAPGRRRRFRALTDMLLARKLQVPDTLDHISYAHPFAHRPLVEFMMAVPPAVVCRPGEPRRLMRRAFAGLLPPAILRRRSKAGYGSVYRQALLPLAAEALRDPAGMRSVELGFVDCASVTARLQAFLNGLDCNEFQLRQVILFEFWLRNRWDPGRARPPRGNRAPVSMPNLFAFQIALST
jgi:asparagine synthase (glutamine-hydrolysing)